MLGFNAQLMKLPFFYFQQNKKGDNSCKAKQSNSNTLAPPLRLSLIHNYKKEGMIKKGAPCQMSYCPVGRPTPSWFLLFFLFLLFFCFSWKRRREPSLRMRLTGVVVVIQQPAWPWAYHRSQAICHRLLLRLFRRNRSQAAVSGQCTP